MLVSDGSAWIWSALVFIWSILIRVALVFVGLFGCMALLIYASYRWRLSLFSCAGPLGLRMTTYYKMVCTVFVREGRWWQCPWLAPMLVVVARLFMDLIIFFLLKEIFVCRRYILLIDQRLFSGKRNHTQVSWLHEAQCFCWKMNNIFLMQFYIPK